MTHYGEGRRPAVEAVPRQIDASLRKFREAPVTKKALPTTARITILIALKCNGEPSYAFAVSIVNILRYSQTYLNV